MLQRIKFARWVPRIIGLLCLVLAGCGEEKLPGERETLRTYATSTATVEADDSATVVALAPAESLPTWTRKNGSHDAFRSPHALAGDRHWRARLGKQAVGADVSSVISTKTTAYVVDKRSRLVAIRVLDGTIVWRHPLPRLQQAFGNQLVLATQIDGAHDRILLARGDGTLTMFHANVSGVEELWQKQFPALLHNSPLVPAGSDFGVALSTNNTLTAFALEDGKTLWTTTALPNPVRIITSAGVVAGDATIFVAMSTGEIRALSPADGKQRWTTIIGGKGRTDLISRLADVTLGPVIYEDTLYVTHANGTLSALRTSNGFMLWQIHMPQATAILPSGNVLFVSDRTGQLIAFNRADGRAIWEADISKHPISHLVQLADTLGAIDAKGRLYWINPLDGETTARRRVASGRVTDVLLIENATMIYDAGGKLTALK